jgi:hypothetical protein
MKRILVLLVINVIVFQLQAQVFTISGYVSDAETGEKLIGCNIVQQENKLGVVSNNYGFYSFTLAGSSVNLVYSYIGYQAQNIEIKLTKDTLINIFLIPGKELGEVVVIENKLEDELRSTQTSMVELPIKELKQLPVLMGETDVLRTIQLLPGVHTGGEGTNGLYVRGGGPDQNQILLDGIQIYNANHLFGFFSVFNTDAIKKINLYKGGFPANYGGRVSSILDIRMKEGNNQQIKGAVSIGLIASGMMLEGPIINENTSFIVSARRTYVDILARPFIRDFADGNLAGFYFYDLTGKINHKFSDNSRIYFSTYLGKDAFYSDGEQKTQTTTSIKTITKNNAFSWANHTAALRWNYIFNQRLFSNTSLTYSNYFYKTGREYNENEALDTINYTSSFNYLYQSGIEDIAAKIDFDFIQSANYTLKFGAEHTYHNFNPGVSVENNNSNRPETIPMDTTYGNTKIYASEFAAYFDNTVKIGKKLRLNFGLRFSGLYVQNKLYKGLEPRSTVNLLLSNKWSLKASYSVMNQYIHLLTNTSSNMPTDLWLPVTKHIKPQHAVQYALGSVYNLNNNFNITVETYFKTMDNLLEYAEGTSFFDGFTEWENMVETGKGLSYGLEILLKKQVGQTTGWVGYTWSKTEREFENINFGKPFPYKYDRRHDISLAVTHQLKEHINLSTTWVYGTGNAFTLPHSQMPTLLNHNFGASYNGPIYHFEERNSYRMPANHRLDIGIDLHKQKKHGERIWSLGVYNVYNRKNAFYLEYDSYNNQMTAVSIFPILPYFKYKFEF